jgi:hypothetical protein
MQAKYAALAMKCFLQLLLPDLYQKSGRQQEDEPHELVEGRSQELEEPVFLRDHASHI